MDVPTAMSAWRTLLEPSGWTRLGDPELRVALILLPALWLDWVQYRGGDELVFLRWSLWPRAGLMALALLTIVAFSTGQIAAPFIYQGF